MTSIGTINAGINVSSQPQPNDADHDQTWDAVETYFECITTCSLDDGECITRCVQQLRESDDN